MRRGPGRSRSRSRTRSRSRSSLSRGSLPPEPRLPRRARAPGDARGGALPLRRGWAHGVGARSRARGGGGRRRRRRAIAGRGGARGVVAEEFDLGMARGSPLVARVRVAPGAELGAVGAVPSSAAAGAGDRGVVPAREGRRRGGVLVGGRPGGGVLRAKARRGVREDAARSRARGRGGGARGRGGARERAARAAKEHRGPRPRAPRRGARRGERGGGGGARRAEIPARGARAGRDRARSGRRGERHRAPRRHQAERMRSQVREASRRARRRGRGAASCARAARPSAATTGATTVRAPARTPASGEHTAHAVIIVIVLVERARGGAAGCPRSIVGGQSCSRTRRVAPPPSRDARRPRLRALPPRAPRDPLATPRPASRGRGAPPGVVVIVAPPPAKFHDALDGTRRPPSHPPRVPRGALLARPPRACRGPAAPRLRPVLAVDGVSSPRGVRVSLFSPRRRFRGGPRAVRRQGRVLHALPLELGPRLGPPRRREG